MTDGGYGTITAARHVKPHRKPINGELSEEQVRENEVISEFRGNIERKFGEAKTKMAVISSDTSFRHGEEVFNIEIRTGRLLITSFNASSLL